MKKLLLIGALVSGTAYGMDERRMLTEILALQRIQTGKDLVKISQKNICIQCGSDNLDVAYGSTRLCRVCGKESTMQELRALAPQGLRLVREGVELLDSITAHDRVELAENRPLEDV